MTSGIFPINWWEGGEGSLETPFVSISTPKALLVTSFFHLRVFDRKIFEKYPRNYNTYRFSFLSYLACHSPATVAIPSEKIDKRSIFNLFVQELVKILNAASINGRMLDRNLLSVLHDVVTYIFVRRFDFTNWNTSRALYSWYNMCLTIVLYFFFNDSHLS